MCIQVLLPRDVCYFPENNIIIGDLSVAFPGFANGGCLRATHVDMRMRRNTSVHLHGTTGFRSFMRLNPALFAPLSIVSYPCASVPGTRGRKQRVLHSRPRASCMLINGGQGGVRTPKSPPWIRYCLCLINCQN